MNRVLLGLGLLVAAAPLADAALLSFGIPGEMEGSVTSTAPQALLVIVFQGGEGSLEMQAEGATAVNHTTFHTYSAGDNIEENVPSMADEIGPFRLGARGIGPTSLVVLGSLRNASIDQGRSHLIEVPGVDEFGGCPLDGIFTDEEIDTPVVRFPRCFENGTPGIYQGENTHERGSPVHFEFEAVTFAEWFGWDIGCERGACPSGGGFGGRQDFPAETYTRILYHQEVVPLAGRLSVSGVASAVLVTGVDLDLSVGGWVRLPQVSGTPACSECIGPRNQTLFALGAITLASLRMTDDGRVQGEMGGELTNARFDEEEVDVAAFLGDETAVVVGAIAATVGLAIIAKLLGATLFTKLSKEKALEHPRRQVLYQYIQEHPGANFRELVRKSEIASGTARHHLSVLKRSGHIVEKAHGGTVRFFENHGKFEATWASVVLLREAPLRQLYDWLAEHPNVPQKAILEGLEAAGWSRSTTQHRLLRLQEGALVSMRPQGRLKFYTVVVPGEPKRLGPPPVFVGRAVAA